MIQKLAPIVKWGIGVTESMRQGFRQPQIIQPKPGNYSQITEKKPRKIINAMIERRKTEANAKKITKRTITLIFLPYQ